MKKLSLSGKWIAHGTNPFTSESLTLDANVPGSILNDIVSQNVEGCDPFFRDNAERYQKYERYNWHCVKEFEVDKLTSHTEIVFEKLDTYCDIYLNGIHLANCDNGHISYTFSTDGILTEGKNTLDIYFCSPVTMADSKRPLPGAFTTERLYTRRTQCTYGWDWVMRFVTCGIGADVYINFFDDNEPRIDNVYIYTKSIDSMGAYIGIKAVIDADALNKVYTFDVYDTEGKKIKSHSKYCSYHKYSFNMSIEDAKLWYPAGYGEQPLYELRISCEDRVVYSEKFGIRTVKILQTTDKEGSENFKKCIELKESAFSKEYDNNTEFSCFTLVVNGVKILCKGANWVPCEPFETGKTKEKITKILELSKDMGVNMIRVWGGGTFETKHFYNECSRLGLMVTQDFLMACGTYPEKESWFIAQLNREADYAAKLIRNQPCLMWWSGDNENAVFGNDVVADYTGKDSACFGIQPVLMELDPERDFFASSPYGGSYYSSNTVGTTHNTQYLSFIFDAIEKLQLDDYKQRAKKLCARFIAEEPTFGAASSYSCRKFMTDEDIYGGDDSIMRYHTKSNPGLRKELFEYLLIIAEKILGDFKDGYDKNFKLKYIQYENVRISLEQLRRERWFCSGVIFWMLEDCWPSFSGWAFIDYYLMPKASYYSFKRCSKPVICSIDKEQGTYSVYVCNDGMSQSHVSVSVYGLNLSDGTKREFYNGEISVDSGKTEKAYSFNCDEDCMFIAQVNCESGSDRAFYKEGALGISKTEVEYTLDEANNSITFKAGENYIHAVEIEGNLILEDNYFSLLPGEIRTVTYKKNYVDMPLDISVTAYGF